MQNIKTYFVDKSNNVPLPSSQNPPKKTIVVDYIQKKDNPAYNRIMLHTSSQNDVPATNLVFHCSIGCYLGFEICLVDANDECVDFCCRWLCSGPYVTQVIQDEYRARAHIIEPGTQVGSMNKVDFGWFCPGNFTLSLDALIREGEFSVRQLQLPVGVVSSAITIIVSEPSIENLSITMASRPDDEDTSPLELGPVSIVSCINSEEVSGTFGFAQLTQMFLERSCSDGSEQVIQTPETKTTIQTTGIEKRVIQEAQHMNCFEKKPLTVEYVTDFNKMFEKSECMEIKMKSKFKTFVAFQPEVDKFPGVTQTFIVKYTQDYLEWEWSTNAVRDGDSWKLLNPSWHSDAKSENVRWRPLDWTKTINNTIVEKNWMDCPKKQIMTATT